MSPPAAVPISGGILCFILLLVGGGVSGVEQCGDTSFGEVGGACPDLNTCCPLTDGGPGQPKWGCIPYNKHLGEGPGVCCPPPPPSFKVIRSPGTPPGIETVPTGCPPGYRCSSSTPDVDAGLLFAADDDARGAGVCRREGVTPAEGRPAVLPRYVLCSLSREALGIARGFPVRAPPRSNSSFAGDDDKDSVEPPPELAYYSSTGRSILDDSAVEADTNLRAVVVIVHGSGRNADDYLCSASAAVRLRDAYGSGEVLIVAPRFLAPDDGPVPEWTPAETGAEPLRWEEHAPISHTWRYGADAIQDWTGSDDGGPMMGVSSFETMDRLVEHFVLDSGEGGRYRQLERVVVAGHSAGGQFAQRWALTSTSSAWGDGTIELTGDETRGDKATKARRRTRSQVETSQPTTIARNGSIAPSLSVVAANPRSYAYPDPRRYLANGTLAVPSVEAIASCPGYDRWEWGLEPGGPILAPYKDRAVAAAGGRRALLRRFVQRDATYLGGTEDVLPLHGSCEDDGFQGPNRLERGRRYYAALSDHFDRDDGVGGGGGRGERVQRRREVPGVPHDHALMFQSSPGLSALLPAP